MGVCRYGNVQPLDRTTPASTRIYFLKYITLIDRGQGQNVQTFLFLWRRHQTMATTTRTTARRLKITAEETIGNGGSAEQSDNQTGPRTGSN